MSTNSQRRRARPSARADTEDREPSTSLDFVRFPPQWETGEPRSAKPVRRLDRARGGGVGYTSQVLPCQRHLVTISLCTVPVLPTAGSTSRGSAKGGGQCPVALPAGSSHKPNPPKAVEGEATLTVFPHGNVFAAAAAIEPSTPSASPAQSASAVRSPRAIIGERRIHSLPATDPMAVAEPQLAWLGSDERGRGRGREREREREQGTRRSPPGDACASSSPPPSAPSSSPRHSCVSPGKRGRKGVSGSGLPAEAGG